MEKLCMVEVAMYRMRLTDREERLQELDEYVSTFINGDPTPEQMESIQLYFKIQQEVNRIRKLIKENE